jgi:hypothetical protein
MTRVTLRRTLLLILLLQVVLFVSIKSGDWLAMKSEQAVVRQLMHEPPKETFTTVRQIRFEDPNSLKAWEEKIFRGKTQYQVIREGERAFLSSSSAAASSSIYMKMEQKVTPDLYLSWRWRAKRFPQKKEPAKLANRGEDDFAARIYVVFPGSNFFNTNLIEYIWDERIPAGSVASSPFSGRVKLFVIRTGPAGAEAGGWAVEERNIYEDYTMLFGKPPDRVIGAIALMSDSDNTKTASEADFGDILFKRKDPINKENKTHGSPAQT